MELKFFNSQTSNDCSKARLIDQLRKSILPLQGFKSLSADNKINIGFHSIEKAFPNSKFPVGCTHEFISPSQEDYAATCGFIAVMLNKLMQFKGAAIWISTARTLFPAALNTFGTNPENIIFVDLKRERDVLYTVEEALKCKVISTVIGEIKNITFKESRRLQLAAEQSRATGFLIRNQPKFLNTVACVSRWRITSIPSQLNNDMPGVGFPQWNVELLKVRNGKPGAWQLEYSFNSLQEIKQNIFSIPIHERRKTG